MYQFKEKYILDFSVLNDLKEYGNGRFTDTISVNVIREK